MYIGDVFCPKRRGTVYGTATLYLPWPPLATRDNTDLWCRVVQGGWWQAWMRLVSEGN